MLRHFTPLILAVGLLAIPATAAADFSSQVVSPTRVTFTGTDSAETLQISLDGALFRHDQPGDPFDFDSTQPGRQSIAPTNVRTLFTAIGRGGDDRILMLTPEASLSADGGDGDDTVIGSDDRDVLRGGSGDDLVAGRGTTDSIDLGPGDDRYEATPKTGGSDRVEGREGNDTALLVGTDEADEFNIQGVATSFEVDMLVGGNTQIRDVETLELELFGGDDILEPELIPATLRFDVEGGTGDDLVRGGAGDDRLNGGEGDDRATGGEGDDVLRAEVAGGGPGNDSRTLDVGARPFLHAEDDDGYDVTRLVTGGGADALSLSQDNSGVRVDGAAFAAVGVGDAFVLETRAGDDSATVLPGAGRFSTIAVDGGDGADVLRGSEGIEWLAGALGDDILDGGPGPDRLLAGGGDDLVRARDRAADAVDCGSAPTSCWPTRSIRRAAASSSCPARPSGRSRSLA